MSGTGLPGTFSPVKPPVIYMSLGPNSHAVQMLTTVEEESRQPCVEVRHHRGAWVDLEGLLFVSLPG